MLLLLFKNEFVDVTTLLFVVVVGAGNGEKDALFVVVVVVGAGNGEKDALFVVVVVVVGAGNGEKLLLLL